ncbi:MAG: hypothetical protein Q9214_006298, partial [Letrouitia sp. 1 TL-2023]
TRPVTTRLPDGSFKKPEYEDGGKRAYERTFPIMFFVGIQMNYTNTCKDTTEKGKSKPLLAAYEKAAEQNGLDYFKDMLADHQKAVKEDLEAQAERDAKKAHKSKRKSTDVTMEDAEDMDVDDEAEGPKPKSKKRKKEFDSDGDEKPASKTPKTGTKLKLSTPKTPAETSSKKKPGKPKISAKKAAKGSDDEPMDTPKVEEKPLTPAEAKRMKEKKELETYRDLEGSIIKTTKINKVLKAIIKLPSIPLDEEYGFKERSIKLLGKWNEILSNDAATAPANKEEAKTETAASTTNGNAAESKEKSEKGESAAPENEAKDEAKAENGAAVEEKKAEGEVEATKEPETSEKISDEPNIESAPAKEYQPPTVEAAS